MPPLEMGWVVDVDVGGEVAVDVDAGVDVVVGAVVVLEVGFVVVVCELDVDCVDEADVVVVGIVEDEVVIVEESVVVGEVVRSVVAVGAAEVDVVVNTPFIQYGDAPSSPIHVCPLAQQIEPHWKSPAAQTREQPGPVAPAGQQKNAPPSTEHVSPAPPRKACIS